MNQRVLNLIYGALTELNEQIDNEQEKLAHSPDTILFGVGGHLDSLLLVNLIVITEQRLEDDFGVAIPLADERAMSMERSPFATVGTFASYIEQLLDEPGNG